MTREACAPAAPAAANGSRPASRTFTQRLTGSDAYESQAINRRIIINGVTSNGRPAILAFRNCGGHLREHPAMMLDDAAETRKSLVLKSTSAVPKRSGRAKKCQNLLAEMKTTTQRPTSPTQGSSLTSPPPSLSHDEDAALGPCHQPIASPKTSRRAPTEQDLEGLNRELLQIQEQLLGAGRNVAAAHSTPPFLLYLCFVLCGVV